MATTGRPPTPTKLKLLRGETRPSRLNRHEPRARAAGPEMPDDLDAAASVVWSRVMREMGASGVITAADTDALRVYCEAVARYTEAARLLAKSAPVTKSREGVWVRNPLAVVVRDNALLVRAYARELGLTPAARASMTTPARHEADAFADFLDAVAR